jgi:hypothetical protein
MRGGYAVGHRGRQHTGEADHRSRSERGNHLVLRIFPCMSYAPMLVSKRKFEGHRSVAGVTLFAGLKCYPNGRSLNFTRAPENPYPNCFSVGLHPCGTLHRSSTVTGPRLARISMAAASGVRRTRNEIAQSPTFRFSIFSQSSHCGIVGASITSRRSKPIT